MQSRTATLLQRMERVDWFSCVGLLDASGPLVLTSWVEAIEHCCSTEWKGILFEANNQYCERLFSRSKDRFNQWNDVVVEMKEVTRPLVKKKVGVLGIKNSLLRNFELRVHWNLWSACMETEFADVWPPGFYANLMYWYLKGHLPCGWQGVRSKDKYPDLYPANFYDKIVNWYEAGHFGDWKGEVPQGKLVIY